MKNHLFEAPGFEIAGKTPALYPQQQLSILYVRELPQFDSFRRILNRKCKILIRNKVAEAKNLKSIRGSVAQR